MVAKAQDGYIMRYNACLLYGNLHDLRHSMASLQHISVSQAEICLVFYGTVSYKLPPNDA